MCPLAYLRPVLALVWAGVAAVVVDEVHQQVLAETQSGLAVAPGLKSQIAHSLSI